MVFGNTLYLSNQFLSSGDRRCLTTYVPTTVLMNPIYNILVLFI
jgi:hypothetical protein